MQFGMSKEVLLKELGLVAPITGRNTGNTEKSYIKIEATMEGIYFSGSDLKVSFRSKQPLEDFNIQPGAIAVPGKKLASLVSDFRNTLINFRALPNDYLEMTYGKSRHEIIGIGGDKMPEIPTTEEYQYVLPTLTLVNHLSNTVDAISDKPQAPQFGGALMEIKNGLLRTTAMQTGQMPVITNEVKDMPDLSVILPKSSIGDLLRLISDDKGKNANMSIGVHGSHVFFKLGDREMTTLVMTGQWPPPDQFIQQTVPNVLQLVADRQELRRLMRIANNYSAKSPVAFQITSGTLSVVAQSSEVGSGTESMDVQYEGQDLLVGFNPDLLLSVLNNCDSDLIAMSFNPEKTELRPMMLRPISDTTFDHGIIVMPQRLPTEAVAESA
jgi:DNA polymerase-3 subunit beta